MVKLYLIFHDRNGKKKEKIQEEEKILFFSVHFCKFPSLRMKTYWYNGFLKMEVCRNDDKV